MKFIASNLIKELSTTTAVESIVQFIKHNSTEAELIKIEDVDLTFVELTLALINNGVEGVYTKQDSEFSYGNFQYFDLNGVVIKSNMNNNTFVLAKTDEEVFIGYSGSRGRFIDITSQIWDVDIKKEFSQATWDYYQSNTKYTVSFDDDGNKTGGCTEFTYDLINFMSFEVPEKDLTLDVSKVWFDERSMMPWETKADYITRSIDEGWGDVYGYKQIVLRTMLEGWQYNAPGEHNNVLLVDHYRNSVGNEKFKELKNHVASIKKLMDI